MTLSAAITFSKGRNGTVSTSELSLPELFNEETIKEKKVKYMFKRIMFLLLFLYPIIAQLVNSHISDNFTCMNRQIKRLIEL